MARSRSRSRSRSVSPSRQGRSKESKHRPLGSSGGRRRSRSRDIRRDYRDDDRDKRYSRGGGSSGDHIKIRESRRPISPRRYRSRSRSPHTISDKPRSRSRSHHRHRSRDRQDSRVRDKTSKKTGPIISSSNTINQAANGAKNVEKSEMDEDLVGSESEESEMLKLMGFGNFNTTKGKQVPGNNVSAVHVIHKRKYRQYMNRKGGFNRPLDFVA